MRFKDTIGISYTIRNLSLELTQQIDQALKPLKLSLAKYSVLSILEEFTTAKEGGLSNAELSRKCGLTPQTMIRLVQSLEQEHLIKREIQSERQNPGYVLTTKGASLICKAHVIVNKIELRMISDLPAHKYHLFAQQLESLLKKLKMK